MIIHCAQGSDEWLEIRRKRVTGSMVHVLMVGTKAAKTKYRNDLVVQRLTNLTKTTFVNDAMRHGIEQQPFAEEAYTKKTGNKVWDVGIAIHDKIEGFAASPDGLVDPDGLLEVKCPTTATHIQTLLTGEIPEEYQWQMLAEMACSERSWADFASFDPRVPHNLQLFVKRFQRDEKAIAEMEAAVKVFLGEVDQIIAGLEKYRQPELAQVSA